MSIDAAAIHRTKASASAGFRPGYGWASACTCCCWSTAAGLLNDSDTYWQIAVGQWILDHRALPRVDVYSFTKRGEPWISSSWLAQVLYAASYNLAGWTGPVVVAAGCDRRNLRAARAYSGAPHSCGLCGRWSRWRRMALSTPHFLARPHVLVLPIMVAWANGADDGERARSAAVTLVAAVDGACGPTCTADSCSAWCWSGAFAIDALWNAERVAAERRWRCAGRRSVSAALVACCATPYGWGSILASRKILDLGELLHLHLANGCRQISASSVAFELTILALIAGSALWRRRRCRRRGSRWCWACCTWRCRMAGIWRYLRCCCRSWCSRRWHSSSLCNRRPIAPG